MTGTTILVTATIFDDRVGLAYSVLRGENAVDGHLGNVSQCEASPEAWAYITETMYDAIGANDLIIGVIDRRPGTRATSRSRGIPLTTSVCPDCGMPHTEEHSCEPLPMRY